MTSGFQLIRNRRAWSAAVVILLICYAIILLRTAWVCDDAYITFRTVDNFINGYGLVWNVGERVQSYSHPLWMFLLSAAYFITREAYLTLLVISMAVSMVAVSLFAFKIAPTPKAACLGIIALILSKSFMDYSTSGLENPLSHLLLAVFLIVYLPDRSDKRSFLLLSFVTALVMLVRLDLALLVLPALMLQFFKKPSWKMFRALLIGFLPLIIWELFSVFYYGFPVPNPAYAKLRTGLDQWMVLAQGSHYLEAVLRSDRLLVFTVLGVSGFALFRRERRLWPLAAGILLYLAYIVWAGGCFMVGRFFTVPFFVAVTLLALYSRGFGKKTWIAMFGLVIILGLTSNYAPVYTGSGFGSGPAKQAFGYNIDDERLGYYQRTGLLTGGEIHTQPRHQWVADGLRHRAAGTPLITGTGVGFMGYYCGPNTHIVDILALNDPLLARLSSLHTIGWKPGHYLRQPPDGYLETILNESNRIRDPYLADYYDTLSMITRGCLCDMSRLRIIVNMNLGRYDHLLEKAEPVLLLRNLSEYSIPREAGTYWWRAKNLWIPPSGVRLMVGEISHAGSLEISLDHNDHHRLIFVRDRQAIDSLIIPAVENPVGGLFIHHLEIPIHASESGFDEIRIFPEGERGEFAMGHILLRP
jgi:arabinofuranosyltransferase